MIAHIQSWQRPISARLATHCQRRYEQQHQCRSLFVIKYAARNSLVCCPDSIFHFSASHQLTHELKDPIAVTGQLFVTVIVVECQRFWRAQLIIHGKLRGWWTDFIHECQCEEDIAPTWRDCGHRCNPISRNGLLSCNGSNGGNSRVIRHRHRCRG